MRKWWKQDFKPGLSDSKSSFFTSYTRTYYIVVIGLCLLLTCELPDLSTFMCYLWSPVLPHSGTLLRGVGSQKPYTEWRNLYNNSGRRVFFFAFYTWANLGLRMVKGLTQGQELAFTKYNPIILKCPPSTENWGRYSVSWREGSLGCSFIQYR